MHFYFYSGIVLQHQKNLNPKQTIWSSHIEKSFLTAAGSSLCVNTCNLTVSDLPEAAGLRWHQWTSPAGAEQRTERFCHDSEQSVPPSAGGDTGGGLPEDSSGRLLRGAGRLCPPSPQRSGRQPGPHRWLRVLRSQSAFPQLTGEVRKEKKPFWMHLRMLVQINTF